MHIATPGGSNFIVTSQVWLSQPLPSAGCPGLAGRRQRRSASIGRMLNAFGSRSVPISSYSFALRREARLHVCVANDIGRTKASDHVAGRLAGLGPWLIVGIY